MTAAPWGGFLPKATAETAPFWEGCRAGRLMLPRCTNCRSWIWYPRPFCPACEAWTVEWVESPGRGALYSFTIVHRPMKGWEARAPYVLAMVDLDEGPRLTATLGTRPAAREPPTPATIRVGMRLRIGFDAVTDTVTLPVFQEDAA